MDIQFYQDIFDGLKQYNSTIEKNYGNKVYDETPRFGTKTQISFPITIIEEIRNNANPSYNSCFDRVASVGYSVNIYAKTKGSLSKKQIARGVALFVDKFLSEHVGLERIGFVPDNIVADASLHRITMTYSGNLHENRRKLI